MKPGLTLLLCACALALAAALGCGGCGPAPSGPEDAGVLPGDAGQDGGSGEGGDEDAGTNVQKDAGPPFIEGRADIPCPGAAFQVPDGGTLDGSYLRGLCIGVSRLEGTATLDGQPAQDTVHLTFDAVAFSSELDVPVDGTGAYQVEVMRARYDRLLYHPNELLQHGGPKDLGPVDLREDQVRNPSARSHVVAGSAFFAGQPWIPSANPADTTVVAEGQQAQTAWTTSVGGAYQVRLLEGQFGFKVSVPFSALGETELARYPVVPWLDLKADTTVDIDIPVSELSGNLTVDGQPLPDRIPNGPDYRFDYTPTTGGAPTVATHHEAGTAFYAGLVPKGAWTISLELREAPHPSLPALLYNVQLAVGLDLTQNRLLDFDLETHPVEGALLIDGVPVAPRPLYNWTLYTYSYAVPNQNQTWFVAYYRVPLTGSSFSLRMLPGEYYMLLWLDSNLAPDLAEGWYRVADRLPINQPASLPIDVQTETVEGTLLIDGVPADGQGQVAGTLIFESGTSLFRHRLKTRDGRFTLRLPKDQYDVHFEINPGVYPDYAAGQHFLDATIDLTSGPRVVTLEYETVAVEGPLRFAGAVLPDALSTRSEATLHLRRVIGFGSFRMPLQGGRPWYRMRIPKDNYTLTFELAEGVLPGVAHGEAELGNPLYLR